MLVVLESRDDGGVVAVGERGGRGAGAGGGGGLLRRDGDGVVAWVGEGVGFWGFVI